ncbi:MAG: hypothetical protein IJD92_00360 [Bacilli bacterium]|nr:hypothetical protein [Bacilli bacterium]
MKNLSKKEKIILFIVSIVAILIRLIWINGESGDYIGFLEPWVLKIRELGGFNALKYNIGDYNVPYMVILTFISFFKFKPLYLIKLVSIIFDFICAYYGAKIVDKVTNNKLSSLITYAAILFLPTVIINGSLWGQCDSIYTSFILISIYYLLDEKYIRSFIFLGFSFAFKLQFMFILPLYVLLFFRNKKIKWWYFLLIPLVNIILCLPAIFSGRSIVDVLTIYLNQTGTYKDLVLNFPNLYNLIQSDLLFAFSHNHIISKIGIVVTLFIFAIMWLYVLIKKVNFNSEKIITVGLWSVMIATYFLPRMHDRYLFAGDILSVIFFMIIQKKFYIPISVNIVSTITYFYFLFRINIIDFNLLSIIYFIVIVMFTLYTFKLLGENNEIRKRKMG